MHQVQRLDPGVIGLFGEHPFAAFDPTQSQPSRGITACILQVPQTPQLCVLMMEPLDLGKLIAGRTGALTGIDLGPVTPFSNVSGLTSSLVPT